ncbi:MAG: hypothetical protein OEX97_08370, partial [Acidimicrobiia bacterium]|nr:hypothetical protein [Acidimicrobiia bacterium]
MTRLIISIVLIATACSTSGTTTVPTTASTSEPATTTTATETSLAGVTTTRAVAPDVGLVVSRLGGVDLLTDGVGIELEGDYDYPVIAAFDDLAGGLVYQYEVTPEQFPRNSILRLPASGSMPGVVLSADVSRTIRLLDVESVDGRTIVLYLEGAEGSDPDSLFIADLAGGAPTLVAQADAAAEPGPAGVTPTAILRGSLSSNGVAVVWWYGDIEAECSYAEVIDFDGTTLFGPVPSLCGEVDVGQAALSPDGSKLAYSDDGTAVVADVETGEQLGEWATGEVVGLDFDGSTVIVTGLSSYDLLSLQGAGST